MIGRYVDGANAVTALNIVVGVAALQAAMFGRRDACIALVVLAALLDHLDGWLARRWFAADRRRRAFGAQFDSLADLLNFDVVPAVLLCALAPGMASTAVATLLVLFGAVRLAHFNIASTDDDGRHLGLPTTFAGFVVVNLVLLRHAGAFGQAALLIACAGVACLQIAPAPLRLPGTGACVVGLAGLYAANLLACRLAFAS